MKPFLYEVAEDIVNKHRKNLSDLCIIFPNKRTLLYFRKYLAKVLGKASLPPKMKEIGRLIREITGFEDAEKLSLIFDLYRAFKKYDASYEFENFYRLGEIILSDFNEIDAWLVKPDKLYRNIKDLKEIDYHFDWLTDEQKEILRQFWGSFSLESISEEQENFIKIWNILPKVYKTFTDDLMHRKLAYNGLIYRKISELIDAGELKISDCEKNIFIGFNALNNAELKLINYYKKNTDVEFYWDFDKYYIDDKKQEAGDFLRKNFEILRINPENIPEFIKNRKKIKIIGASMNINQAKILNKILNETDDTDNTAIITADEAILFPVLSALPEKVEKINVTMGYPFKLTPLFNFISEFFRLHINSGKNKNNFFRFKDVEEIIGHPYIKEYNSKISEEIKEIITEKNLIYLNYNHLPYQDNELIKLLFSNTSEDDKSVFLLNNLLEILFIFFDKSDFGEKTKKTSLKNEYIFRAYKKIKRFREILIENEEKLSLKLMSEILLQILKSDSIPFESEADEGLQIMGLMESRNLDFKNVIILGMNEGNLPKISVPPSFISQSLRFAFGMPVIKFQDAIFAYFFYRLLQRSENLTLIYNNLVNDANSGEMSRFLTQIIYESGIETEHFQYNEDITISTKPETVVIKDEEVIKRLQRYLPDKTSEIKKSFSPTAVNTYKSCGLKFYYRYIADLKQADELSEELTAAEFGEILHKSLELIYFDLKNESENGYIREKDLDEKIKISEVYVNKAFAEYYKHIKNYSPSGIRIIVKNVLNSYVKRVLNYDKKTAPFEVVSLEDTRFTETTFDINIKGVKTQVKLSGIIDRVDKKDDIYRIIDYKSGKAKKTEFDLNDLFDGNKIFDFSDAFQTVFYSYVLSKNKKFKDKKIKPELFYVQEMNKKDYSGSLTYKSPEGKIPLKGETLDIVFKDFTEELKMLIEEIFNSEFTFNMTGNNKICEYCEFSNICY